MLFIQILVVTQGQSSIQRRQRAPI